MRRPASELQGITVVHLGECHELVEVSIYLRSSVCSFDCSFNYRGIGARGKQRQGEEDYEVP